VRETGKGKKDKRKNGKVTLTSAFHSESVNLADKMLSSGYVRLDCEVGGKVEELGGKLKDTHEQRPEWYLDDDDSCGLYDPLLKVELSTYWKSWERQTGESFGNLRSHQKLASITPTSKQVILSPQQASLEDYELADQCPFLNVYEIGFTREKRRGINLWKLTDTHGSDHNGYYLDDGSCGLNDPTFQTSSVLDLLESWERDKERFRKPVRRGLKYSGGQLKVTKGQQKLA
jgi:hypothetical protein